MMLHHTVLQELDAELRRHHDLPVTEFEVLITLFNAPDRRLRMSELAQQVLLSPAGTTHLVTRLERDRLVRREVDPADGRKWFAVLTDQGDRIGLWDCELAEVDPTAEHHTVEIVPPDSSAAGA